MRAEIAKAVSGAMQETKEVAETVARSVANDVAQQVTQTALEAFHSEDPDSQTEFAVALKAALTESEPPKPKRRAPRVRLERHDVKLGMRAVARAGNNHIPVKITAGPFMVNGKILYEVERLTPGKNFTGGTKPLQDLYAFTQGDEESLSSAPPPSASRRR